MPYFKYFFYLCLIIAPTQANPAAAVLNDSKVVVSATHVQIAPGQNASVTCTPGGSPLPRVRWSKYAGEFGKGTSQSGNTLIISNALRSDTGHYMCVGVVDHKVAAQEYVYVEVKEEERPKSVKVSQKQLTIRWGQNGSIDCIPQGSPLPHVQWRKEVGRLSDQARQEGNTLIITNAQAEDSGVYVCHAILDSTSVFGDFARIVVEGNEATPYRPDQLPKPLDVTLDEGQDITISCDFETGLDQRPLSRNTQQSGRELIVQRATKHNEGEYLCKVTGDRLLLRQLYVRLSVNGVQRQTVQPRVAIRPETSEIVRGQTLVLECVVVAGDDVRTKWERVGGSFSSRVENRGPQLVFRKIELEDAGSYICIARNNIGETAQTTQIVVVDVPPPTPPPSQGSSRVVVSETQVKLPRGGNKKVECIPEGSPLPRPQWTKVKGRFGDGIRQEGNLLVITNVQDSDAGNYRCTAVVQVTPVYEAYLQVIVEDVPAIDTNEPSNQDQIPTVAVSESSLEISKGDSKTIDCTPKGYPLPTVRWTKESGEFASGTRQEGNALVITNAEEEDRGNYICSAVVEWENVNADYLTVEVNSSSNDIDRSICQLPAETKWCFGNNYYYDINEHKCTSYGVGGCGSNANDFVSEEACNLACDGV